MSSFEFELNRKLFHLLGILFPLIYLLLPKSFAIVILLFLTLFVVGVDVLRGTNSFLAFWSNKFLGPVMREEERQIKGLSGSSWMILGILISCLGFEKYIAIASWFILFICDALAAIIGKKYGQTKLIGNKTFEGSASFFLISIILGMCFINFLPLAITFRGLIFASIASTLIELYAKEWQIDDNLAIPLVYGICLSIF